MAVRNTNQVATYLPQNIADQLKAVAERHKWSMALATRVAIVEFLQRELVKSADLQKV